MRSAAVTYRSAIGLALTVVALAISPIKATAGASACLVENQTSGSGPQTDLQQAIDEADPGDVLAIEGICPSSVLITKDLILLGTATPENPAPTLAGAGNSGSVVTVAGTDDAAPDVRLTDLTVTSGSAQQGGGIYVTSSRLNLAGDSAVIGNVARRGGGVYSQASHVLLSDSARVSGNTASSTWKRGSAGGIFSREGILRLIDQSRVTGNEARVKGGGILAVGVGRVVLADTASVRRNQADRGAGIQSAAFSNRFDCGDLVLRQEAVVSGNRATGSGGGILHKCQASDASRGVVTVTGHTRIVGNSAGQFGGGLAVGDSQVYLQGHTTIAHNESRTGAGMGARTQVTVSDHVRFEKNRAEVIGGAIFTSYGGLTLKDSVRIRDNRARIGAGIASYTTVAVRGETAISGNTADLRGGGIWNAGALQIGGHAKVRRNQAQRGAGILIRSAEWPPQEPRLIMARHATVLHNVATGRGGGIVLRDGIATLRDNTRVIENRAGVRGGGILNVSGLVRLRDQAAVRRNIPDDCVGC